jgi:DNA-binding winged helix-turn-helix (wHTH) protein
MLHYLIENRAQLVTKAALLDALWPTVTVSDSAPGICVAELRKALSDNPVTPHFIETVHGRGYRFGPPGSLGLFGARQVTRTGSVTY